MSKKRRRPNNSPNKGDNETYIEKVAKAASEQDDRLKESISGDTEDINIPEAGDNLEENDIADSKAEDEEASDELKVDEAAGEQEDKENPAETEDKVSAEETDDNEASGETDDNEASEETDDNEAPEESDVKASKEPEEKAAPEKANAEDEDEEAEDIKARNREFEAAKAELKKEDSFEDSPEYRKILRHQRRVRNQIIAYIVTFIILGGIGVGIYFGSQYVMGIIKNTQAQKAAEEQAIAEEEAEKEEIVITAPETTEAEIEEEDVYEEELVEMTSEDYLNEMVETTISQMSLEDKVAQLFMITPEALTGVNAATKAGEGTKEALANYAVGGLIYDRKNIESDEQLEELISNTKSMSKYEMFIGVKEPGGENSMLAGSSLTDIPSVDDPATLAESGDATNAYNAGVTISSYLSYYGFNLDLAPNGSITTDEASISASESYGSDEAVVYEMMSNMIKGLQTGTVNACLTDFPGTGAVTGSTADGRVESEISADDISAQVSPYITGTTSGAQFIQVNNVTYVTADSEAMPASLSKYIVETVLRGNMGYEGVVISGPLNDKAITEYYTADQAALYAYAAGVDMLYMPEDFELAYNAVLDAVKDGTIPESRIDLSLERIFKIKLAGFVD